ncbi:MAG: hypothetical protein BA872_01110 [Desulfobacterales bacterium C00003060]|nr:MAG: hypothetical protein BA861_02910 [Desulfobacterales bacterium S3730MH5]OEU79996.1 MAG: hypothetical protein BA865_04835 [Desulfobacterales bacterium S5133MH4]OEU81413.1 MAG: hypothetical protein BA872_01110 [Desulfobacterales bacterium C00003060]
MDILEWVRPRPIGDGEYAYEVWIDPRTGQEVDRCPWLKRLSNNGRYFCRIHEVKPTICRYFPGSKKHAHEIGCKGFDPIEGSPQPPANRAYAPEGKLRG